MESVKREKKNGLVKEFLFHSTCQVRNGNLLESCVVDICVKQIHINQGVNVCHIQVWNSALPLV